MIDNAFMQCKTFAITKNLPVIFYFDTQNKKFFAKIDEKNVQNLNPSLKNYKVVPFTDLPNGVAIYEKNGKDLSITFEPNSTCSERIFVIKDKKHTFEIKTYSTGALWEIEKK